jgi:hypothetical protein
VTAVGGPAHIFQEDIRKTTRMISPQKVGVYFYKGILNVTKTDGSKCQSSTSPQRNIISRKG